MNYLRGKRPSSKPEAEAEAEVGVTKLVSIRLAFLVVSINVCNFILRLVFFSRVSF